MNDTHGIPNEEIKARPIALEIAREKIAQVEAEGRTIQAVDIWESLCAGLPLDADINVKRLLAWVRDQGVPIELADEGEDDDRGTGRTRRRTGAACRSGSRRRRRRPSSMRPGAFGTRRTDMAKKKAIKTEGEVEQALKLWIGRVLCEKAGLDEDQASEYVKEHAEDILEDLSDAIEAYEGTNPYEERISEDQEDEAVVDRPVILDPKEFSQPDLIGYYRKRASDVRRRVFELLWECFSVSRVQGWADLDKGHQELIRHVLHEQHKAIWEDFANHTEGGWWLDQDWSNLWERATKKAEVAILLAIHDYEDQDDEKVEN